MKLFGAFEAIKFPKENLIFVTHNGCRYYCENKDSSSRYGGIILEFLRDRGFLYSIEENMSMIYEEYAQNGYKNDIVFNQ